MALVFRHAKSSDLSAIVAIYNASIPLRYVTADTEAVSIESKQEWFAKHDPDKRPLLVAELDSKICGWLSFHSFYGRPAYSITAEIGIYLDPEFHGQGLGKQFLEKAIALAPDLKIENLLGFIFENNTKSIKLFRSYGFEEWGTLPDVAVIDENYVTLKILGLKIKS